MPVTDIPPEHVGVSPFNERATYDPDDDDEFQMLVDSIEQTGVQQPPIVQPTDDGDVALEAYVGQRRVLAAREAAGVDEIPVIIEEVDELEALVASITENTELFSKRTSPDDRAQSVQMVWEAMGGDGTPTFSHVASELGVPPDTVRTWYEPMRDEWEGTSIDPRTDDSDVFDGDGLGERSLSTVRVMAADSEDAEAAAEVAAEVGATQGDLEEAKSLVDEMDDVTAPEAVRMAASDDAGTMEISVEFGPTMTEQVEAFLAEHDVDVSELVSEAVAGYIESQSESDVETKAVGEMLD